MSAQSDAASTAVLRPKPRTKAIPASSESRTGKPNTGASIQSETRI